MNESKRSEITQILHDWNSGNAEAKERLIPLVYSQLRRQAALLMSRERSEHTLQPTALVHEAFLRLSEETGIEWQNRSHFYGIAANMMRQILIQHARRHAAQKRGSGKIHFSLNDVQVSLAERSRSILALDEALGRLAEIDEQHSKVVEMRFFGGFQNDEIAEALGVSVRTVNRILAGDEVLVVSRIEPRLGKLRKILSLFAHLSQILSCEAFGEIFSHPISLNCTANEEGMRQ